jgi:hypothetical protein
MFIPSGFVVLPARANNSDVAVQQAEAARAAASPKYPKLVVLNQLLAT